MRVSSYRDERLVLADAEKAEKIDRRNANANRLRLRILLALVSLALVSLGPLGFHSTTVGAAELGAAAPKIDNTGLAPPPSPQALDSPARQLSHQAASTASVANSGAKAEDRAVEEEADDGSDPNEADGNGDETDRRKGAGGDVRRDGGDGSDADGNGDETDRRKGAGGDVRRDGGDGSDGGEPLLADSRAVEHMAAEATSTPAELRPILPMLAGVAARATDAQRLPRLLRYPSFNLTWTRSAPPPRSDGWKPTDAQRLRLPLRDLKESYFRSCAVVGSSGTLRRSGYGPFIDAHEAVIRFNGAPAGGGYGADVGARTTLSVLADIATSECVDNKAKQPFLEKGGSHVASASSLAGARLDASNLLLEAAPSWRPVRQCDFYQESEPPATIFFLPRRGGVRRLLDYIVENPQLSAYIRSDALADEVDEQIAAYKDDSSHPTAGFNGVVLALHLCELIDLYGFGTPRDKFYSAPRTEKSGSQHLYRTELRWMLGLEQRFPDRVRLWP
jgi:hypothetical protein